MCEVVVVVVGVNRKSHIRKPESVSGEGIALILNCQLLERDCTANLGQRLGHIKAAASIFMHRCKVTHRIHAVTDYIISGGGHDDRFRILFLGSIFELKSNYLPENGLGRRLSNKTTKATTMTIFKTTTLQDIFETKQSKQAFTYIYNKTHH